MEKIKDSGTLPGRPLPGTQRDPKNRLKIYYLLKKGLQTSIFVDCWSIFGIPLGPRGPPGTSREPPRIALFFNNFEFRPKTCPDGPPGGPREAPRHPQGTILDRFLVDFACQTTSKKCRKMLQKHGQKLFQNLENNLTLIRATVDVLIEQY